MNFYFLRFLETPIFTVHGMSINTLHISSQFSFRLPVKKRNLCILYPAFWDSCSPALLIPSFQIPENVFHVVLHLGDSAVSSLCSSAGGECSGQCRQERSCFLTPSSSCGICKGNPIYVANVVGWIKKEKLNTSKSMGILPSVEMMPSLHSLLCKLIWAFLIMFYIFSEGKQEWKRSEKKKWDSWVSWDAWRKL